MSNEEPKQRIADALKAFSSGNLTANATKLFNTLGYTSPKSLAKTTLSPEEFLDNYNRNQVRPLNPEKALVKDWKQVHFLFQLTGEEIKASGQFSLDFGKKNQVDNTIIESYLFFALALTTSRVLKNPVFAKIGRPFRHEIRVYFHSFHPFSAPC